MRDLVPADRSGDVERVAAGRRADANPTQRTLNAPRSPVRAAFDIESQGIAYVITDATWHLLDLGSHTWTSSGALSTLFPETRGRTIVTAYTVPAAHGSPGGTTEGVTFLARGRCADPVRLRPRYPRVHVHSHRPDANVDGQRGALLRLALLRLAGHPERRRLGDRQSPRASAPRGPPPRPGWARTTPWSPTPPCTSATRATAGPGSPPCPARASPPSRAPRRRPSHAPGRCSTAAASGSSRRSDGGLVRASEA